MRRREFIVAGARGLNIPDRLLALTDEVIE
jgi:hypothetical protein